jgi:ABC-type antimicrobial peptide transport system permease subunit
MSKAWLFISLICEVLIVSIAAGIIGGVLAMACSGMTVNLQLATVLLQIPPSAILTGVRLAITLGILGSILPIIKLSFAHHQIF